MGSCLGFWQTSGPICFYRRSRNTSSPAYSFRKFFTESVKWFIRFSANPHPNRNRNQLTMNRLILLLIPTLCLLLQQAVAGDPPRPNILYLYADDMGWGAIGANGQDERRAASLPAVKTPNLDKLAAEGVNFTRAYGCTVCSPARSSQQTGMHQGHTFADRNDPDNAKKAMRAEDVTMGDVLSAAGYTTGYWGKWGFGGSQSIPNPEIVNIQTLPTSHGYEHVLAELHHIRAHTFFQPTLWHAPAKASSKGDLELIPNSLAAYKNNPDYPDYPARQNHPGYPEIGYCDDLYAFHALDFVRQNAQAYNRDGTPFFALVAVQIPHAPFGEIQTLPEWDEAYRDDPHFASLDSQSQQWAAMVTRIDAHFGHMLHALEDPNNDGDTSDSVADNTLVIFMSDNGGPQQTSNDEFNANHDLRKWKTSIYEGGIRVPTIMRWPAQIHESAQLKPGTSNNVVIDASDLLPTFSELAGAEIPLGLDGVSLAPFLSGATTSSPRQFLIHEAKDGQSIIEGDWKLVRTKSGLELYNLVQDHSESTNIADQYPKLVDRLHTLLLGERVDEPKGFAVTYHHWRGDNNTSANAASNWTDYIYRNEGITYMTDDGAPRLSWIATMHNTTTQQQRAHARKDLEFLALEIGNGQELILHPGTSLTARNELRLLPGAVLSLKDANLTSLRPVSIRKGATLKGQGEIHAPLNNKGTINLTLTHSDRAAIQISGNCDLGGDLQITIQPEQVFLPGTTFVALSAHSIRGHFTNPDNQVMADDGTLFRIAYTPTTVTLTAERTLASR